MSPCDDFPTQRYYGRFSLSLSYSYKRHNKLSIEVLYDSAILIEIDKDGVRVEGLKAPRKTVLKLMNDFNAAVDFT